MDTTYDIFPPSLLIARSSARPVESQSVETAPQIPASAKASSSPWEMVGVLLVLMIAMALVGLWSWTLVEFLRFFVETMPQPNGLGILQ